MNSDYETVECSECGHLHFVPSTRSYIPCPLADEGCECIHSQLALHEIARLGISIVR
jgi:hypothetical protein